MNHPFLSYVISCLNKYRIYSTVNTHYLCKEYLKIIKIYKKLNSVIQNILKALLTQVNVQSFYEHPLTQPNHVLTLYKN